MQLLNDMQSVFACGLAFGVAIGSLVAAAYAWDKGYDAGELAERRRHGHAVPPLDGIGEVL